MSEQKKVTPVSALGEFGLIEHLTRDLQKVNSSTVKGVGDDAAVIDNQGKQIVVTTDLLVEGIHFDIMYTPLKHLGYKSVVVNLSDIYAMNAEPKQITVSLAISSRYTVEALDELYEGIKLACKHYKVDLVGGDTTSSLKGLIISVTAIGEANTEDLVYRSGAKEGNLVCVSGDLGGAYLGLQILEREKRIYLEHPDVQPELENADYLIGRQLKPEARKDVIQFFKEMNLKPTAMMDLSDGLSSDIFHLCKQSGVGCELNETMIPVSEDAYNMALKFNLDPVTCALNGGEDYELMFTIEAEDETKLFNYFNF
jgi:thiamine-monophosphate kinase